ncbi:YVTN repeat-like/Quino protein amine dehydrogenase [Imleria badia]|nr:YVTN repeat-like/Quino protein amine dehydrogenase [Imleria badia]
MTMPPITAERRNPPIEINQDGWLSEVTFSANGEYLLGGGEKEVQVWRADNGKEMARMAARHVQCLTVSKDGRWIAAGTLWGHILVWNAETYETVISHEDQAPDGIVSVDFSPDSTRFVVASKNWTASVWDMATNRQAILKHDNSVIAAKYSAEGDRIATATRDSVRVYNSKNGCLLVDLKEKTGTPSLNTGLLWSNEQLFVVSTRKIKKIDASTGSTLSEWPVNVLDSNFSLSRHGDVIVSSVNRTVTLWDASTHSQLSHIQHPQCIASIAFSPDDRFLAIGGKDGKITIKQLARITAPDIQVDCASFDVWKYDQLANTKALSTPPTREPQTHSHRALASRALVRARLRQWDAAIADAKESIKIEPSIIGYIAKSMALVGKGEKNRAYRACDIAYEHFHSTHVSFLLLIKAIVVFMAGDHDDAISRVDDLIDAVHFNSICYVVQAQMHLFLGNSHMGGGDYTAAIRSFERARAKMRNHTSRTLLVVSVISGWKFDNLAITIQCQLCEALRAAGHVKEAGEVVLETTNIFGEEIYMSEALTKWLSNFTQRCLATAGSGSNAPSKAAPNDELPNHHLTPGSSTPSPLLREWARANLMYGPWKDAFTAARGFMAPRFIIHRAICERLETIDHIFDASECFHQMVKELTKTDTTDERVKWILDFRLRCYEKLERVGDAAVGAQRHDDAIIYYSAAISLNADSSQDVFIKRSKVRMAKGLWEDAVEDAKQAIKPLSPWGSEKIFMEWAKVDLMNGVWKGVLSAVHDFEVPRLAIYRAICEGLETPEGIMDAIECFHQMVSELTEETIMQAPEAKWVLGKEF